MSIEEGSLVTVLDDQERVKEIQGEAPGWHSSMEAILGQIGYVKRKFSFREITGCRVFFGNSSWSFNNKALRVVPEEQINENIKKYSHLKVFNKGDVLKITTDLDQLKEKEEEEHIDRWNKLERIAGKLVFVKKNLSNGRVQVRFGKNTECIIRVETTQLVHHNQPIKTFSENQVVKVKSSWRHVKNLQQNHGEWSDEMKEIIGQEVKVLRVISSGDVKIIFNDKHWTINSFALLYLHDEEDNFYVGDHVSILPEKEKVQELQKGHGGYTPSMDAILGKVGEVIKILPKGDLKVSVLGKGLLLNSEAVTKTDEELSIGMDEDIEGKTFIPSFLKSSLPEFLQQMCSTDMFSFTDNEDTQEEDIPEGCLVRVVNDEEKLKEIQGIAPGWVPSMAGCIGKVGYVKQTVKFMNVAKVYFGDRSWRFNMAALQKINQEELQRFEEKYVDYNGDFLRGDFVRVIEDTEIVKAKQEGHGGWNEKIEKVVNKIGFVKMTFPDGDPLVRFGSSAKYRINKECLKLIFTLRKPKKTPSINESLRVISSLNHLVMLQKGHGDQIGLEEIMGKEVSVQEILPSGDVKVLFDDKVWTLNPMALKDLDDNEGLFNPGDHVKIIPDKGKVKRLQVGHGEYTAGMDLFLGKVGMVISKDSDGDLRVRFPMAKLMLNPEAVIPTMEQLSKMPDLSGFGYFPGLKEMFEEKKRRENEFEKISEEEKQLVIAIEKGDSQKVVDYFHDQEINKIFAGRSALHFATKTNQVDIVRFLLNKNAKLDIVDYKGRTPLLIAIKKEHHEITQMMILKAESGDSHFIDLCNSDGDSSLHLAISKNNIELAKQLIELSPNLCNLTNNQNRTPLHSAAIIGNIEIVPILLKHGPGCDVIDSDGDTPLHDAITRNHLDFVKMLIEKNSSLVNVANEDGRTPLHIASIRGHEDIVKYLLDNGASCNDSDSDGDTPLHYAVIKEQLEIVRILVQAKCECKPNNKQKTPLHIAVKKGYKGIVKVMIENGADLSQKNNKGNTALHVALMKNHPEIAELLIQNGSPIDVVNEDGFYPLHMAALKGELRAVSLIIDLIIENDEKLIDEKKNDGYTALHLAAKNNHAEILQLLLLKGKADPDIVDNKRETALHVAVEKGYDKCVKTLVQNGADIDQQNSSGNTAMHIAVKALKNDGFGSSFETIFQAMFQIHRQSSQTKREIIKYLTTQGSNLYIKNNKGKIPLDKIHDEDLKNELINISKENSSQVSAGSKRKKKEISRKERENSNARVVVCLSLECQICVNESRSIVFSCGHSVCETCSNVLVKCPFCMMEIEMRIPLLL